MKRLLTYILESTATPSEESFFGKILKNMEEFTAEGKDRKLDADTSNLQKPNEGIFDLDDALDTDLNAIIENNDFGFTHCSAFLKNPNKYFKTENGEDMDVVFTPYITTVDDKMYIAAIIIFDIKYTIVDDFVTVLHVEPSNIIGNTTQLNAAVIDTFAGFISEQLPDKIGMAAKPALQDTINALKDAGFKPLKDNKEILTKSF